MPTRFATRKTVNLTQPQIEYLEKKAGQIKSIAGVVTEIIEEARLKESAKQPSLG